jgi:hypothetical protein
VLANFNSTDGIKARPMKTWSDMNVWTRRRIVASSTRIGTSRSTPTRGGQPLIPVPVQSPSHSSSFLRNPAIDVFAADLNALMEHLNLEDAVLFGSSMGTGWTHLDGCNKTLLEFPNEDSSGACERDLRL